MLSSNSWRVLVAFEAICIQIARRPIARAFHFYFQLQTIWHWYYCSKRPNFAQLRLMGGLVDIAYDWKEYFWVIQVDPLETKLDFQYTWCQLIHYQGEL